MPHQYAVVAAGSGKIYWWGEITTVYVHINIMETKIKVTKVKDNLK